MESNLKEIERDITSIKERNRRVEADKAWETSGIRIGVIIIITYIIATILLYLIGVQNFFVSALVPTAGFFLSVQTLPLVKRWWVKKFFWK